MPSYVTTFGNTPVNPSQLGYSRLTMLSSTTLVWPDAYNNINAIATIMVVDAATVNLSLILPPANRASSAFAFIVRNVGANAFIVAKNDGSIIISVPAGGVYFVYVSDVSTAAGVWGVVQLGVGTSAPDAASLAGAGLKAIGTLLNFDTQTSTKNANYTIGINDRAKLITNTSGAVTFTLPGSSAVGNGWMVFIRNAGTGTLTIAPTGTDTVDGNSNLSLNPTDSCIIVSFGTGFYSIGLGRSIVSTLSRLIKPVPGGTDVTLTAVEAAYSIIEFTGALTANINIIVPASLNQWTMYNGTTGAFTLTVKTAAGTGKVLPQNSHNILYCDGTNVNFSVDASGGTVTSVATGTGLTGGPITTSGTIALANTAVTPGAFGTAVAVPTITIDQQGRITAAANTPIVVQTANIADNAVTTLKIVDGAITTPKLADGAVTPVKLAPNTIPYGYNNRVINGGFQFNQRNYTSAVTLTSSSGYAMDRWWCFATGTTSGQFSRVSTNAAKSNYCAQVQRVAGNTGTGALGLIQAIETANCSDLHGKTITVSFWAWAGANFSSGGSNLGSVISTGQGVDQTAASNFAGTWTGQTANTVNHVLTTTPQLFTRTFSVPSTATQLAVWFNYAPVGTAGAADIFYVTDVFLNDVGQGYDAPPFAVEFDRCLRYFDTSYPTNYAVGTAGIQGSGLRFVAQAFNAGECSPAIRYSEPMRVQPTLQFYSPVTGAAGKRRNLNASTDETFTGVNAISNKSFSGGPGPTANTIYEFHFTADAEL